MLEPYIINQINQHFQHISKIFKQINTEQIQIHCPFCDDASRPNAMNHGHLYISYSKCVFHCFRCNSSGTLFKLLISTDFKDNEVLSFLAKNIKYNFIKDYYGTAKIQKKKDVRLMIKEQNLKSMLDPNFNIFRNYLYERIGTNIDYTEFLISLGYFKNNLSCDFFNYESQLVVTRLIQNCERYRYHKHENSNGQYYFQDIEKEYKNVILTEGVFDLINVYIYNYNFDNSFFLPVNNKNYLNPIESLICRNFLIGNYTFNIIFDNDDKYYGLSLYRIKRLCSYLNPDIIIKGYLPKIGKDTGVFPGIVEVQHV